MDKKKLKKKIIFCESFRGNNGHYLLFSILYVTSITYMISLMLIMNKSIGLGSGGNRLGPSFRAEDG